MPGTKQAKSQAAGAAEAEPICKVFSQDRQDRQFRIQGLGFRVYGSLCCRLPWLSVPCIGAENLAEDVVHLPMTRAATDPAMGVHCLQGKGIETSAQLGNTGRCPSAESSCTSQTHRCHKAPTAVTGAPTSQYNFKPLVCQGQNKRKVRQLGQQKLNPSAKSSRKTGRTGSLGFRV